MKEVLLSADGPAYLYLVPDEIADNLEKYCMDFCDRWIWGGPESSRFIINNVACYGVDDFIYYLNKYVCPDEKARLIRTFTASVPKQYRFHPYFNF
ncbi:MAG: hypothetical protein IKU25_01920 [Clostridia bacterium]|nr:hypothetical protein [Clostridia bacterium]